jgi:RsiW-degrading membrane proteinase PrsW (M82 family)
MNFIKKHEFLFGGLAILSFLIPLILQLMGVYTFVEFDNNLLTIPLMAVLAIIPAIIWIKIFNKENPEEKTTLIFAFFAGCTSTIPIFFYQKLFTTGETGNFIFFKAQAVNFQNNIADLFGYPSLGMLTDAAASGALIAAVGVFLVFMGVGALEEIVKHTVVNTKAAIYLAIISIVVGGTYMFQNFSLQTTLYIGGLLILYLTFLRLLTRFIKLQSIDDAIEVAIVAALGFAFVENVHYFSGKFGAIPMGSFIFFVIIRVTVVSIVHVLCSGIMGYHAGLATFAHPVLQDEIREGRKLRFIGFMHRLFQLPTESIFRFEQMFLGLLYAIGLHALYDFLMQLKYDFFGIPMFALIMPLYFIGGLWYLFSLLEDKEDHKKFGRVVVKEEFVK